MIKFTLLFIILKFTATILAEDSDIIVKIVNGQIRGKEKISEGASKSYYAFNGIPYAQPPIGELRFDSPKPALNWEGVLNATEDKSHCPEANFEFGSSEDCLYLNVYTPQNPTKCTENKLPVIFWIFGGAFLTGHSSYASYGPDYFLDEEVLVVSFNYRLGALGFLSTEDNVIPGNFGLKDQLLALQWVNANIASFCGDPSKVTIMGQSAGAAGVAYLLQAPAASQLFSAAIMHSGSSLNLWSLTRNPKEVALAAAAIMGIEATDSRTLLAELREKQLNQIALIGTATGIGADIAGNARDGLSVGPVLEADDVPDALITGKSHELLKTGQFNRVPMLMGFNSFEANVPIISAVGLARPYLVQYDLDHRKLLPKGLNVVADKALEAASKIKEHYFSYLPISLSSIPLLEFVNVDQWKRPMTEYARVVRNYTDVYFYEFAYEGQLGGRANIKTQPGVAHSEELPYFWRSDNEATDDDKVTRSRVIKMWTNFAKWRNPTPDADELLQKVIWKPVGDTLQYLKIDKHLEVLDHLTKEDMLFWDEIYDSYGQPPFDTY